MNQRLDIDLLRTLKAVHECGGVTRAASQLSLTQSAVSHKIRRFEHNLGCSLLRREPGSELLTGDGKQLVAFAEKIIAIHDEALSAINKPRLEGTVRLGITEELVSGGLAVILGRYRRLYPAVKIYTRVEQSLVLQPMLEKGDIDMAVMQLFIDDLKPTDHLLYRQSLHWAAGDSFEYASDKPLPFIAFDEQCFYRQWAESTLESLGQQLDIVLQCASNEGVRNAVDAGMGVALLGEKHCFGRKAKLSLPDPPDIAFVVRTQSDSCSPQLAVLQEDISNTLGQAV